MKRYEWKVSIYLNIRHWYLLHHGTVHSHERIHYIPP